MSQLPQTSNCSLHLALSPPCFRPTPDFIVQSWNLYAKSYFVLVTLIQMKVYHLFNLILDSHENSYPQRPHNTSAFSVSLKENCKEVHSDLVQWTYTDVSMLVVGPVDTLQWHECICDWPSGHKTDVGISGVDPLDMLQTQLHNP